MKYVGLASLQIPDIFREPQIIPKEKNLIFFEKGECSQDQLKLLQNQAYQNKTFF